MDKCFGFYERYLFENFTVYFYKMFFVVKQKKKKKNQKLTNIFISVGKLNVDEIKLFVYYDLNYTILVIL